MSLYVTSIIIELLEKYKNMNDKKYKIYIYLERLMAYVIVYQRSIVITTSVKTDSSVAKTVRNPAT